MFRKPAISLTVQDFNPQDGFGTVKKNVILSNINKMNVI